MRAELISIAAMLAAVGVSIWLLDWAQRGWREIAREPVEAWGDVPFLSEEARGSVNFAGEGTVKAAPAQKHTHQGSHSFDGTGL